MKTETSNYPGVNTPLNITASYFGDFVDVQNTQGGDYSVTFNSVQANQANSLVMNPSPTQFVTSQANAYFHVTKLRNWIRDTIPGDATADFRAIAKRKQHRSWPKHLLQRNVQRQCNELHAAPWKL